MLSATKTYLLEDGLSFPDFCEQIHILPISPEDMEAFKDKARVILKLRKIKNYSQRTLLDIMYYDLYLENNYRI